MNERPITIKKFVANDYYSLARDINAVNKDNLIVKLKMPGLLLIAIYYLFKYSIDIIFPDEDVNHATGHILRYLNSANIQAVHSGKETRQAFLFQIVLKTTLAHSTPIFYLKNKDYEFLFIADSLGRKLLLDIANELRMAVKLPIVGLKDARQLDGYSCHTDVMVMCKLVAGLDINGNYCTPDLINQLMSTAIAIEDGILETQLPSALLLTTQNIELIANNEIETKKEKSVVHYYKGKAETISDFLTRYQDTMTLKNGQYASGYLRYKGIKYADTIEIQYYINQIEQHNKFALSHDTRASFILRAKDQFKIQDLSTEYERPGLYELATQVIDELLPENNNNNTNKESVAKRQKRSD